MNTVKYYRAQPSGLQIMHVKVTQQFQLSTMMRSRPYVSQADDAMLKQGFTRHKPINDLEE